MNMSSDKLMSFYTVVHKNVTFILFLFFKQPRQKSTSFHNYWYASSWGYFISTQL